MGADSTRDKNIAALRLSQILKWRKVHFCNYPVWRFVQWSNGWTQEKYKSQQKEQAKHCHSCPYAVDWQKDKREWSKKVKKFLDFVYLFRTWKFDLEYLLFCGAYVIWRLKQSTVKIFTYRILTLFNEKSYARLPAAVRERSPQTRHERAAEIEPRRIMEEVTLFWRTNKFYLVAAPRLYRNQ